MKKKLVAALSILAIFAFAIAAFAYTQTTSTVADKPSCCKSKDSCPMKAKGHDGHDANGEHAKMDCCKKHGGDHAKTEGKSCDCCGDSRPMKKDGASATAATAEGKDCCDNCDCCKAKKETSV